LDVDGNECDPSDPRARRFCAIGAFIRAAFNLTGDYEAAQRLGWQVAGLVAENAGLALVDDDELGWGLAMLNDRRGQAAELRAVDALISQRRS
jgi:hypothetical protein